MTRAAFLPTPGDPFLLRFWLDFFETRWGDEVDALYADINVPPWIDRDALRACEAMLRRGGYLKCETIITTSCMSDHGTSINRMLQSCSQDMVLLCEDDAPVIKHGMVSRCFDAIEEGKCDIVGSPRMSCPPVIYEASKAKYGLTGQPPTDIGPNWWPCFFFVRRSDLLRTDRNFSARGWKPGEVIEGLGITATEPIGGDTFVWASIQLRAMGLKARELCQYHSYPHDLDLWRSQRHLWDGHAPWLHIGSLSCLVGTAHDQYMFADPTLFAKYIGRLREHTDKCSSTRLELTRRYAWVNLIWERTHQRLQDLGPLRDRWYQNLNACIDGLGLDRGVMGSLVLAYKELLS